MNNLPEKEQLNEDHIILWFINFDFPHDEISRILGLQPTRIAIKGEEVLLKDSTPAGRKHRKTYWAYEWRFDTVDFIGDAAERFIQEVIGPRINEIRDLAKRCDAEFKIAQYYYDGFNPGYHFSVDSLKILSEAGLDLDIDVYCFSEE